MNTVYAVGIGPGGRQYMTEEAIQAMAQADVITGYRVYVDLVRDLFPDKTFYSSAMKQEIERCRQALELAQAGQSVAMVCSGDAGVYGMAGLLYELADQYEGVDVEVVSGVTAALSGAAVLGAPIGHDLCLISLSDLLTPWEQIARRLRCAGEGDFAVCLYNPKSKKRSDHLTKACQILMEHKDPDTVCGWVRNIGRQGQAHGICRLAELPDAPIDMFTTVFIGSRNTRRIGSHMVTPRGYEQRQGFKPGQAKAPDAGADPSL